MIKNLRKAIGRRILAIYKRSKQKSFNPSLNHCLNTARSMLKKTKYCFLITNSSKQWPSARMVQRIVDLDTFVIWLGTNPTLKKSIVPEPFGLKPIKIIKDAEIWQVQ